VPEHKGYFVLGTKVCNPVPAKHAFDADNHVIDIWENQIKEQLRVGFDIFGDTGFTFLIDDADIPARG
jgi:hypothetical protein